MFHARFKLGDEEIPFNFDVPASKKPLFRDMDHIECADGLFMRLDHVRLFLDYFYKPFDHALPQSFWDEYYNLYGMAPRGIWSYRENKLFGEFVSRDRYMEQIKLFVEAVYQDGDYFDVKERELT